MSVTGYSLPTVDGECYESIPFMKWLIFGCGGVGGYFGARIAQCPGQQVSFMVRTKTLAAIKEHGVRITSICGDCMVHSFDLGPTLDTQALDKEEKFEADVIMLGCKAWEAKGCLEMCEPWCGKETVILPLQNGVEGLTTIKEIVASWGKGHALAGCCNIVSAISEPGWINHWAANPPYITYGEFTGKPTEKTLQVKKVLDACKGMEGHLEEDVLAKIWEKFTFICATTGVQATSGPYATQDLIPQIPELLDVWKAGMQEIIALCRSEQISYPDAQLEKRIEVLRAAKGATTSCSRDLWAGKASEVDDLLGSVVRMGKEKGIPTPTISAQYSALIIRDRIARGETRYGTDLVVKPSGSAKIQGPMWQDVESGGGGGAAAAAPASAEYKVHDKVEYLSATVDKWFPTMITAVHPDGTLEVAVKPGAKVHKARVRKF